MSLFCRYFLRAAICAALVFAGIQMAAGQSAAMPKVTKIDTDGLSKLLKPNGKPLLINFWATWCDPCREEFPDLVKIDAEYRGKIDFITISLDDLADIDTFVPKFLSEVKATMPAYLLKTDDETAAIKMVSNDWAGNLPMTVLLDANGKPAYQRNGKIRYPNLVAEIDKVLVAKPPVDEMYVTIDYVRIKDGRRDEALYFYENNWKLYRDEALKRGVIHSYQMLESIPSTTAPFDLILITWYKNEEQHNNSEKNFEPILKELRPTGPKLKNSIGIDDFRQSLFVFRGKAIYGSIK